METVCKREGKDGEGQGKEAVQTQKHTNGGGEEAEVSVAPILTCSDLSPQLNAAAGGLNSEHAHTQMNTHLPEHEGADFCCRSQPNYDITVNTDHQLQGGWRERRDGEG